jgi:hypothetical protein
MAKKILKQGCLAPNLKLLLHKLYGRHHDLVERCDISISQMTMDVLIFT